MPGTNRETAAIEKQLAGLIRDRGDNGNVTRSGRCPDCGYLLTAAGHQTACGQQSRPT